MIRQNFQYAAKGVIRFEDRQWSITGYFRDDAEPPRYYYELVGRSGKRESRLVRSHIVNVEAAGRGIKRVPQSGFYGVYRLDGRNDYTARHGESKILGHYPTRREAARVVDDYMREHGIPHGWAMNFAETEVGA